MAKKDKPRVPLIIEPRSPLFLTPGENPWSFLPDGDPTKATTALDETRRRIEQGRAAELHADKRRETEAINATARDKAFDAAVAAEAKRLDLTLAISREFADVVGHSLKAKGVKKAGRDKVLDSVRRLVADKCRKSTGS